jgi:hypothetical protein
VQPSVFGRREAPGVAFEIKPYINSAEQQPTAQQLVEQQQQREKSQQLQQQSSNYQQQQQQQSILQQQQEKSITSLSPSIPVSAAPVPKFGFKFGGLRIPAPTDTPALTVAAAEQSSPVKVASLEQQQHVSLPHNESTNPVPKQSSQRFSVSTAVAPSLLSSRASKPQSVAPTVTIDVSSRAAQLIREIGEADHDIPAAASSVVSDHIWRERSSRSVAGDVGPHIVAHAKVDTGLPRELSSRDRARVAVIYRCSSFKIRFLF